MTEPGCVLPKQWQPYVEQLEAKVRELEDKLEGAESRFREAEYMEDEALAKLKVAEATLARVEAASVGAIPETTDYANGWNDCRKSAYDARQVALKPQEKEHD